MVINLIAEDLGLFIGNRDFLWFAGFNVVATLISVISTVDLLLVSFRNRKKSTYTIHKLRKDISYQTR